MSRFPLVLASASQRRRVLLKHLVDTFTVDPVPVDESAPRALPVPEAVQLIARKKALATSRRHPDAWVLSGDTVVVRDGNLVNKARDPLTERATLAYLSGHTHEVVTGLALVWGGECVDDDQSVTRVRMERLSRDVVDRYVESGQWRGKAGGYGIQDPLLAPFLHLEEGPWSNVVGLPLATTAAMLKRNRIPCREPPGEEWLRQNQRF